LLAPVTLRSHQKRRRTSRGQGIACALYSSRNSATARLTNASSEQPRSRASAAPTSA
jgi:hypothetical protein